MGTEIERKFLVASTEWRALAHASHHMVQGYLANTERGSIRVRLTDDTACLNIKGMTLGVTRTEFDYPIPLDEAQVILDTLCLKPLLEKTRHLVRHGDHVWEIDEFTGDNAGLIVAEVELRSVDEAFTPPPWLGEEVSHDPRYYNVCLVERPYNTWKR